MNQQITRRQRGGPVQRAAINAIQYGPAVLQGVRQAARLVGQLQSMVSSAPKQPQFVVPVAPLPQTRTVRRRRNRSGQTTQVPLTRIPAANGTFRVTSTSGDGILLTGSESLLDVVSTNVNLTTVGSLRVGAIPRAGSMALLFQEYTYVSCEVYYTTSSSTNAQGSIVIAPLYNQQSGGRLLPDDPRAIRSMTGALTFPVWGGEGQVVRLDPRLCKHPWYQAEYVNALDSIPFAFVLSQTPMGGPGLDIPLGSVMIRYSIAFRGALPPTLPNPALHFVPQVPDEEGPAPEEPEEVPPPVD